MFVPKGYESAKAFLDYLEEEKKFLRQQSWESSADLHEFLGFQNAFNIVKKFLTIHFPEEFACSYKLDWVDEVGDIWVCKVHGENSKHTVTEGTKNPSPPCLAVDPYEHPDA